jgi:hypothetical protein
MWGELNPPARHGAARRDAGRFAACNGAAQRSPAYGATPSHSESFRVSPRHSESVRAGHEPAAAAAISASGGPSRASLGRERRPSGGSTPPIRVGMVTDRAALPAPSSHPGPHLGPSSRAGPCQTRPGRFKMGPGPPWRARFEMAEHRIAGPGAPVDPTGSESSRLGLRVDNADPGVGMVSDRAALPAPPSHPGPHLGPARVDPTPF